MEQINKDEILEQYRIIKGDIQLLNKLNSKDIGLVNKSSYGFSAISDKYQDIKKKFPETIIERASLEDIFLAKTEVGQ